MNVGHVRTELKAEEVVVMQKVSVYAVDGVSLVQCQVWGKWRGVGLLTDP